MTDILLKDGTYHVDASNPYELSFAGANDILLPFTGTIVIPEQTSVEPDFSAMGMHQWMFFSFRYPQQGSAGKKRFPFLRTFENKTLEIDGHLLFLVEDDISYLDDIDLTKIFSKIKKVYDPEIKENITLPSRGRFLLIRLDDSIFSEDDALPKHFTPTSRSKGFKLRENSEANDHLVELRTALGSTALSGKIFAFDLAGQQVEAYSAMLNLGIDKTPTGTIPPVDGSQIKIQFVDMHGNPLSKNEFPVNKLEFKTNESSATDVLSDESDYTAHKYYTINFTGDDRKLKIKLKDIPESEDEGDTDEEYKLRFIYIAYFPGYNFEFKEITGSETEFDLIKDFHSSDEEDSDSDSEADEEEDEDKIQPVFLRLCVFHPDQEFQTKISGDIQVHQVDALKRGEEFYPVFSKNKFRLFSEKNEIKVFNAGKDFFKDFYSEVKSLKDGDELFLTNWQTLAHLHLNGSMTARGITPNDQDVESIDKMLQSIKDNSLIVSLDEFSLADDADKNYYILIPNHLTVEDSITDSCMIEIETIPSSAVDKAEQTHKGFFRKESVFGLKLTGDATEPAAHRMLAYWKNSMGIVFKTGLDDIIPDTMISSITPFPVSILSLGVTDDDPPKAVLKRMMAISDIESLLLPAPDPSITFALLIINLASGESQIVDLIPVASTGTETEIELTQLENMMATDTLAIAVINKREKESQDFTTTLLTSFREFGFNKEAHLNANIPLHPQELGGLLRTCIAKDVKVKALYWEQFLENLDPGIGVFTGHTNNAELTAIINQTIDSKRAFAVLDRATRQFGSFHQKASVILKKVQEGELGLTDPTLKMIAYLGGIDLTKGRWDTQEHYRHDPERINGRWYDVHIKITGDAALDVLMNFKHRWQALSEFTTDSDCKYLNFDTAIETDVAEEFKIPDPVEIEFNAKKGDVFVQINRTISPFSCYSGVDRGELSGIEVDETGELAALVSYKKAITNAKKFILINDQYFFSQELALDLHNALINPEGPHFAIIILPKDLSEAAQIDPLLFKQRQKAILTLYYGGTDSSAEGESKCGKIHVNAASETFSVKHKVAILAPVNREDDNVYVHSKHLIVDDIWMTIGSSNMNNRSMTYDAEINAAVIGKKLYKGGTHVVREQRMEICRQLLGLPEAYRAILQDPYATFALFKAIEKDEDGDGFSLHPLKPMVKWLDINYFKKIGEEAFDNHVDFVASMDANSNSFNFLSCNLLDPDGRTKNEQRLGYLAQLAGKGKNAPTAQAIVTFTYSADCESLIRTRLAASLATSLVIRTRVMKAIPSDFYELHRFRLAISPVTDNIILETVESGEVSIPISTDDEVIINAQIVDESNVFLNCEGTLSIDPETASPPILSNSVLDVTINISTTG